MSLRDDMLKMISQIGGGVRTNMFRTEITPPESLALNSEQTQWLLNATCRSSYIPGRSLDSVTVRTGGDLQFEYPHTSQGDDVEVEFYLDRDGVIKSVFDKWQELCVKYDTNTVGWYDDLVGTMLMQPMRNSSDPALQDLPMGFTYIDVWPKTVSKIRFSYDAENEIALLPVTLSYRKWEPL